MPPGPPDPTGRQRHQPAVSRPHLKPGIQSTGRSSFRSKVAGDAQSTMRAPTAGLNPATTDPLRPSTPEAKHHATGGDAQSTMRGPHGYPRDGGIDDAISTRHRPFPRIGFTRFTLRRFKTSKQHSPANRGRNRKPSKHAKPRHGRPSNHAKTKLQSGKRVLDRNKELRLYLHPNLSSSNPSLKIRAEGCIKLHSLDPNPPRAQARGEGW